MNNEERELINKFFDRVGGSASSQPGSVPVANQMPPVDPDADRLIKDNLQKYPEAGYRMTQMAVVQEAALVEAQNRIRQLEWQVQQTSQQMQQMQQQSQNQPPASGGFLGGLFGGNRQQSQAASQNQVPPPGWGAPNNQQQFQGQQRGPQGQPGRPYPGQQGTYGAPPPQNYPPGYQQGMFNRGGGGFLGSALTTAAGVAGGMFAYNALSGMFGGSHAGGGAAAGGAVDPAAAGAADPFGGGADPFAGTGAGVDPNFDAGAGTDAGWGDDTSTDDSGWGGGSDDSNWGDDSF
ncbi:MULTISPECIES: DUF2076 domain-containing protein [Commensalibacter]|uniref:Periplasmic ligand-binding sensor protein n=2 Tax=Commensalibacter TaxID=1079922 RepID=W7E5B7_9PROT|nr:MULTISPECIES: DUF2076 domain-containing protein [Commensalibacter]EUK18281.1 hypothetical protein COMX_00985 [Commensalibacter papalotli (ex Servin-Garciduenas et al. 2014)]CAI3936393.1 DUF2076 domain [Commensalibacter papalotli (ex Botero et al. 2024)]CAI3939279.1 DUF2076 domain [Commensalibacter papalotli (ex Botero et al. 2024)]